MRPSQTAFHEKKVCFADLDRSDMVHKDMEVYTLRGWTLIHFDFKKIFAFRLTFIAQNMCQS